MLSYHSITISAIFNVYLKYEVLQWRLQCILTTKEPFDNQLSFLSSDCFGGGFLVAL